MWKNVPSQLAPDKCVLWRAGLWWIRCQFNCELYNLFSLFLSFLSDHYLYKFIDGRLIFICIFPSWSLERYALLREAICFFLYSIPIVHTTQSRSTEKAAVQRSRFLRACSPRADQYRTNEVRENYNNFPLINNTTTNNNAFDVFRVELLFDYYYFSHFVFCFVMSFAAKSRGHICFLLSFSRTRAETYFSEERHSIAGRKIRVIGTDSKCLKDTSVVRSEQISYRWALGTSYVVWFRYSRSRVLESALCVRESPHQPPISPCIIVLNLLRDFAWIQKKTAVRSRFPISHCFFSSIEINHIISINYDIWISDASGNAIMHLSRMQRLAHYCSNCCQFFFPTSYLQWNKRRNENTHSPICMVDFARAVLWLHWFTHENLCSIKTWFIIYNITYGVWSRMDFQSRTLYASRPPFTIPYRVRFGVRRSFV